MWHVHADLHESRIIAGLEYLATTVVFVEPQVQLTSDFKAVNIRCGRVRIRTKKRNGRVREQVQHRNFCCSKASKSCWRRGT